MGMQIGTSKGSLESFEETSFGGDTIVFGAAEAKKASGVGLVAVTAILCLWLFAYISGLFPYLGQETRSERQGAGFSMKSAGSTLSLSKMLLFEGQTAFIDYDVRSDSGGAVRLDLKPYPGLKFSEAMMTVEGTASGRFEVVVPQTGIYEFHHDFALNGAGSSTEYSVTWGAL